MLDVHVRFFKVNKCGYYSHGSRSPQLSSIEDALIKLADWARDGREFVNTTTYGANPNRDLYNTYFNDWAKNELTGDHVLVLWNEVPNDNGVIYGKNPLEHPGSTNMLTTGFSDENVIPGLPSYFWFIPEHNAFATLKFQHSYNGKGNLDAYLNGFLRNKSPYRVFNPEGSDQVIGYSLNGTVTDDSDKIRPSFQAVGMKNTTLEHDLLRNIRRITKLIKKEELSYLNPDNRQLHERVFDYVFSGLTSDTPEFGRQTRLITHELQYQPSETELRQIVRNFNESDDNSLKNVGFQYNDGTRVMLSGTSITNDTRLSVRRSDDQSISAELLLETIVRERANLLVPLNDILSSEESRSSDTESEPTTDE
ncbi:hypothetical protein [Vibrio coralliirubri]|uniref:hypothetical protein n=1 Tax=Vibrio coralliirubri TaxID=1516159 RepID=UPI00069A8AD4|nr:hypothetical protein [Vibrio coralliirubri]